MKKQTIIEIGIFFTSILLITSFVLHTYYVSVCSIDYNITEKKIEVSLKFIGHDLEKAIQQEHNIDLNIGEENQHKMLDSILNEYIFSNFQLQVEGKKINLNLLGTEFNLDESFYVYYQAHQEVPPNQLEITNVLLTSVFNQQENITYVNFGKRQQSYSFNKINTEHTYQINE